MSLLDFLTLRSVFDAFDAVLANRRLPTSNGSRRRAYSNEFCLLWHRSTPTQLVFQHLKTRSWIKLDWTAKGIEISEDGIFDEYTIGVEESDSE